MPDPEFADVLSAEDNKLLVLARATRARTNAPQGAAVRDFDGRTYAGATVNLPSLQLSAIQVCLAMAIASGAKGLEAVVVFGHEPTAQDHDAIDEFAGAGVAIHLR